MTSSRYHNTLSPRCVSVWAMPPVPQTRLAVSSALKALSITHRRSLGCGGGSIATVTGGRRARQPRTWAGSQNRNHHEETLWETQRTRAGEGGPTSRGRIRPPLPEFKGPQGISGEGTPEDGKCGSLRCCEFPTSLHQIIELRMCTLSNRIRERPNWWEEAKDKNVIAKWRKDILRQQETSGEPTSRRLTPAMVKSCSP